MPANHNRHDLVSQNDLDAIGQELQKFTIKIRRKSHQKPKKLQDWAQKAPMFIAGTSPSGAAAKWQPCEQHSRLVSVLLAPTMHAYDLRPSDNRTMRRHFSLHDGRE